MSKEWMYIVADIQYFAADYHGMLIVVVTILDNGFYVSSISFVNIKPAEILKTFIKSMYKWKIMRTFLLYNLIVFFLKEVSWKGHLREVISNIKHQLLENAFLDNLSIWLGFTSIQGDRNLWKD